LLRKKSIKLTKFELEVMEAIWDLGRASVREVQESLPERKRAAYTTIQTIIHRLELKGAVQQVRKIGNAHIYEALLTRDAAHQRLINDLLEVFGGSAQPLMAHLAESGKLTLEDLKELENLVEKEPQGDFGSKE
jgi:BlaI family transcriptional regulator, penicillinase repressor